MVDLLEKTLLSIAKLVIIIWKKEELQPAKIKQDKDKEEFNPLLSHN